MRGHGEPPTPSPQPLAPNNHSQFESVIDAFGAARLLTFDRDPVTRGPTVEVAHEALLREWKRLRGWFEESRNDIRMQRLLAGAAAEWLSAQQDDGFLLRDSRLEQFAGWAGISTVALTQEERNFLDASVAAREARVAEEEARRQRELEIAQKLAETERGRAEEQTQAARRLQRRAVYLGVALAAAIILIVVAIILAQQSSQNAAVARENAAIASTREAEALIESEQRATAQAQAEDQAQLAFSRELAAAALNNLDVDPERSILLALQALSVTHTLDAENALHRAIRTSRVRRTLVPPGGLRSVNVIYSPDGRRLFTNGEGGGVMWDLISETILYEIPSAGWIKHAEFSPDGSLLALPEDLRVVVGNNPLGEYHEDVREGDAPLRGNVTIVEAETGKELVTFVAHDIFTQLVNFSRDGRRLVTTSAGEVKVWDVETLLSEGGGQPLLDLEGHEEIVWMARFSPDGKLLATSGNKLTYIWDAETGEELLRLDIPAYDVIFSPDGSLLLTAHIGTVDAWDIESGQKVFITHAHAHDIESMRLSPDGTTVATMGNDGKAKLFDYSNDGLRERMTLAGHSVTVGTGDFSPDGRYLATGSLDGTVRIWDITPNGSEEAFVLAAYDSPTLILEYSPDGKCLVTLSGDGTAKIWDTQTGNSVNTLTLSGHSARVNDATISPDGKTIATASEDTDVILWDAKAGQQIRVISGHDEGPLMGNTFVGVTMVDFSPDGEKLVTAGADGKVKVFDVNSGQELLSIIADPQRGKGVTQVTFTPDGRRLVTSIDAPSVVRIWDANTGEELSSLPAVSGSIVSLALSPDGKRLAISEHNGPLYMWSLDEEGSGSDVTADNIRLLFETKAHPTTARGLNFSPDGSLLATAGLEGTVKIWDAMTGQALLTYEYANGISGTAISPDGKYLAASGIDGLVHITLLNLDELTELARTRVTRSLTEEEYQQYLHLEACPADR